MSNFSHQIASLYIQGCHVGLEGRYIYICIYIYIHTIGCIFRPKAVPAVQLRTRFGLRVLGCALD